MTTVGIIGGTGLSRIDGFEILEARSLETPYGDPSHSFELGRDQEHAFIFLARHGYPGHIPPHLVNYRANLWALNQLGAEKIIAVNAVGAIRQDLEVGDVVICDQIIDYTYGRANTYFEDRIQHVDFTRPYDPATCDLLERAAGDLHARKASFRCRRGGVYGCTQGPRLETAAEIERMRRDGCDVVGMTAMPETSLAAELAIPIASLALVVNPAAGPDTPPVDLSALEGVLERGMADIRELLALFLASPG